MSGPPVKQTSSSRPVALGAFTRAGLGERASRRGVTVDPLLRRAMSHYLADHGSDRAAWRFPSFRRQARDQREATPALEVSFADDDWRALETEARSQGVTAGRLLDHAALYYLADLATGRLATGDLSPADEYERAPPRTETSARDWRGPRTQG